MSSIPVRVGYAAISKGIRLPNIPRISAFKQQSQTIDAIRSRNVNVVLDAGANRGFYALHLRMAGYTEYILSFEPVLECFQELSQRAACDSKWLVFNSALGDYIGELEFNIIWVGNELVMSSPLVPMFDFPLQKTVVPITTVEKILLENCPVSNPRLFLKMDTQGYDLKVFAGSKNAKEIKLLQSELSVKASYENMPHYTEALTQYENSGFELLEMFIVARSSTGAIRELDALMGRF